MEAALRAQLDALGAPSTDLAGRGRLIAKNAELAGEAPPVGPRRMICQVCAFADRLASIRPLLRHNVLLRRASSAIGAVPSWRSEPILATTPRKAQHSIASTDRSRPTVPRPHT